MSEDVIAVDDPRAADIGDLLSRHLTFAASQSPPENVFALDVSGLLDPAVTLYSYRRAGDLLAIGALKHLSARHGELKSMHTAAAARGAGIGRAILKHLIGVARDRGYRLLSLETGSMAGFAPARALYAGAGFTECGAFADYEPSPHSTFMSLALD
jgi:putative acetyltransferase